MIIIGFVLHFFCIYIDEDQESPSSQADTAKGRMVYVLCNLNLVKCFQICYLLQSFIYVYM